MRAARLVRRELDLWRLVWQQVETFVDRIDGARDQDQPHRLRVEALLRAAAVVERHRGFDATAVPLAEPVVDSLPAGRWSVTARRSRVPGTDELELAVGMLAVDDSSGEARQSVRLAPPTDIFERRVDGALQTLRLPSYPGAIVAAQDVPVDITAHPGEGNDASSLFSRDRRRRAATDTTGAPPPIATWSELCARRRSQATPGPGGGGSAPASAGGLATTALSILNALAAGTAPPAVANAQLSALASQARAAASSADGDGQVLNAAADVLDEEGAKRAALPGELRAAAEHVAGRPAVVRELADAADALRASTSSGAARNRLRAAANALLVVPARPALLTQPVETGVLRGDLDDATGARAGYPDGTLRVLRALEGAFVASWPGWLRWFTSRNASVLQPLGSRFRRPFTTSLRSLVEGGATGLDCQGLTVGQDATVGSDTVVTAQPATLAATLDDLRPGQVGVVLGDRPAALVVLGLGRLGPHLTLGVSPLRLSVAPGGPGRPGVLPAGEAVRGDAPGLSAEELRSGESVDGPGGDGLVEETVSLWSRLCLVYGSVLVEGEIGGALVPEPSPVPLASMSLFGKVPPLASVLVIAGAPDAFWQRGPDEPLPLVARPGEVILVRGRAEAEGDEEAGMVQAAMEVETVFRATGSMLEQMELAGAARLSTSPLEVGTDGEPQLRCGPEEDVIVVMLRRSWLRRTLTADVTLRRDFAGFDLPCLATERILPETFLRHVLGRAPLDVAGVDREQEFGAALETFNGWLRFAA